MTDRAKTIVAIILVFMTGWTGHLNRQSDNLSDEILSIQIDLNTFRIKRELAPEQPDLAYTKKDAFSKAIRKNTAALRKAETAKISIERALDLAVLAISCIAAALAADRRGAIILVGSGFVLIGVTIFLFWQTLEPIRISHLTELFE